MDGFADETTAPGNTGTMSASCGYYLRVTTGPPLSEVGIVVNPDLRVMKLSH